MILSPHFFPGKIPSILDEFLIVIIICFASCKPWATGCSEHFGITYQGASVDGSAINGSPPTKGDHSNELQITQEPGAGQAHINSFGSSFDTEKQPPPISGDVALIKIHKCPIGKDCVTIENSRNTSLCAYMRGYPHTAIQAEPGFTTLACDHPKASAHLEVASLIAFCPTDLKACIDRGTPCASLENVLTPEQASGPHYHVVCDQM